MKEYSPISEEKTFIQKAFDTFTFLLVVASATSGFACTTLLK
jgi:hypothetical protein